MRQKILCVCQGGNCRSVALAYLLKYKYQIDALACGWEGNSKETIDFLCNWADGIYVMETSFKEKIPPLYHYKTGVLDVGPDRWCNSFHPELLGMIDQMLIGMVVA